MREYLSKHPALQYKDDSQDDTEFPLYISKLVDKDDALVAYISLVLVICGYIEKEKNKLYT